LDIFDELRKLYIKVHKSSQFKQENKNQKKWKIIALKRVIRTPFHSKSEVKKFLPNRKMGGDMNFLRKK